MKKIIVITGGARVGAGGHTVYASMPETKGRNAPQVGDEEKFAAENGGDLRAIEMDVVGTIP